MEQHFVETPVRATEELRSRGITPRELTAAVRSRRLIRVRRGHYAMPGIDPLLLHAVRIGGRLTCVSALRRLGIWVVDEPFAHVSLARNASRLRSPRDRFLPLTEEGRDGCTLHWGPTSDDGAGWVVPVVDALRHALRCQPPQRAIASIDSALYVGAVHPADLDQVFAGLPRAVRRYQARVNGQSMSGIETIVRLIIEDAGLACDIQVPFAGVGTVDLVVENCVVIETDGRAYHRGEQQRDYRRDAALAARGYIVLRFDYSQVLTQPGEVLAAVLGALRVHRAGPAAPPARG